MNRLEELLTQLIEATPEPPSAGDEPESIIEQGALSVAKRAPLLDEIAQLKDIHRLVTQEARTLRARLAELDNGWTQALQSARLKLKLRRRAMVQIRRARALDAL